MKKFIYIALIGIASHLSAQDEPTQNNQKTEQLQDIDKSIEMLKKWQKKFINQQRSYESRRRRVLFKTKTPKDAQRADRLAEEARQNALEIQTQIDQLVEQKKSLLEAPL